MFVNSNQFVECDRYLYTSPKFVFSVLCASKFFSEVGKRSRNLIFIVFNSFGRNEPVQEMFKFLSSNVQNAQTSPL